MQVISLNSLGLKHRQIAAYLNCKENTVKSHLKSIRKKLGYPKGEHISRRLQVDAYGDFDKGGHFKGHNLFPHYPTETMPWGDSSMDR